jgi:hypothetical protein
MPNFDLTERGTTQRVVPVWFVGGSWDRSWIGPTTFCPPVDFEQRGWLENSATATVGRLWSIVADCGCLLFVSWD